MDRIDAMRLFMRVADAGSFSRAAAEMGIGQPTVSRRIQDLEHQLGGALFQRTTRSLSLTEAGQRFYARAGDLLGDFDEAEAEVRGLDHEPVGQLRISCAGSFGYLVIGPKLAGFMDKHPHIRVDLKSDDTYTDLAREGIDLAFRLGTLSDSGMMAKKLGEAPRALWAAPSYLERRGVPEAPADLTDHCALIFRQMGPSEQWVLKSGDKTEAVTVKGRFQASSGLSLRQAADDGLGILLAPNWLVSDCVGAGKLVRVLPDWDHDPLLVSAVWTSGKLRGKARLLIDHLAETMKFEDLNC